MLQSSVPDISEPPSLEANASTNHAEKHASLDVYAPKRPVGIQVEEQKVTSIVGAFSSPDTLYGRSVDTRLPSTAQLPAKPGPDRETNGVNILGGGFIILSLILALLNPGGWAGLAIAGVTVLAFFGGIFLLFYQGPNGRLRLKREARRDARAAERAILEAGNPATVKTIHGSPSKRTKALLLFLVGAALLLVGTVIYPASLLLFGPLGVILASVGLVGFIDGI